MKPTIRRRLRATHLALAAAGISIFSALAFAQSPDEEVIVQSRSTLAHASPYRAQDPRISITRRVSYADLDLATSAGARELEARINSTAQSICEKLYQMDPASGYDPGCYRDAVRDGMAHARVAIAAAQGKMRTASR